MRFRTLIAVVAAGYLLGGCMPVGENGVRKAVPEQALTRTGEADGQLVSAEVVAPPQPTRRVDAGTARILDSYGTTLRENARRYGLDYRLILAVMRQESGFYEAAESEKGARGLMQIMPGTGVEVSEALELTDFTQPHDNIRGGIYYLSRLYRMFKGVPEDDRIRLALAAYNAGIGRVYDAQQLAAYMSENPTEWGAVRDALPLLSKRYYTLHKNVWPGEKPPTGWFGDSEQTLTYVDNIMGYYDRYKAVLN